MEKLAENILLEGCLKKQRTAQFQLFEQYKTAMFSTLYRMLGDYDDAQDALQEGFVQVFKRIEDFKKQSTLGAWIKKQSWCGRQLPAFAKKSGWKL